MSSHLRECQMGTPEHAWTHEKGWYPYTSSFPDCRSCCAVLVSVITFHKADSARPSTARTTPDGLIIWQSSKSFGLFCKSRLCQSPALSQTSSQALRCRPLSQAVCQKRLLMRRGEHATVFHRGSLTGYLICLLASRRTWPHSPITRFHECASPIVLGSDNLMHRAVRPLCLVGSPQHPYNSVWALDSV